VAIGQHVENAHNLRMFQRFTPDFANRDGIDSTLGEEQAGKSHAGKRFFMRTSLPHHSMTWTEPAAGARSLRRVTGC
jgi:hypothetical protein